MFTRDPSGVDVAQASFPVERDGTLTLLLLAPDATRWRVLGAPEGAALRDLDESFALERRVGFAGEQLPGWIVDRRDLRGVRAGRWTVRVESKQSLVREPGWLLVSTESELRAEAHVATLQTVAGEPIAVVARAAGRDLGRVETARLTLELDGAARDFAMFDDGLHDDGAPDDGGFGAWLPVELSGAVRARAELSGVTRAGRAFARSAPLAFEIEAPRLMLAGSARAVAGPDRTLELALDAYPLGPAERLHVSAEVWGRTSAGRELPVCWLSRIQEPRVGANGWSLALTLDMRWLDAARVTGELELRQVRVQDPDSEVVLAALASVVLDAPPFELQESVGVNPQMLMGPGAPLSLLGGPVANVGELPGVAYTRALMLVHGYCSSGSIWPAVDFAQPKLEFLDPNANRSHDQFAQLLDQRAQQAALASFGVVGHSQGGPAALHLFTYYTSGLDRAEGPRRIQSVASPYQGTPLASLGSFACGTNSNMTPAGAATWLSGIPTWARSQVYYWSTSNSGSACNFFTGLLLTDPEDGTVEQFRCQLPGANNMGHVVGWCHTTGMSNPANYTDHARNQALNAAAAR